MTHDQRLEASTDRLRTATAVNVTGRNLPYYDYWRYGMSEALDAYIFDHWSRKVEHDAPRQPWHGPKGRWLTVYHVQLAYGGAAEGGWWYEAGDRVEYVDVTGRDASAVSEALSEKWGHLNDPRGLSPTNSDGGIIITGPDRYPGGECFPNSRPQYE